MMWVYRKFIETISLFFYTCMAVHVSGLLFSAGGGSATTSKGVLSIICVANCLELPRLADQLNSLPRRQIDLGFWPWVMVKHQTLGCLLPVQELQSFGLKEARSGSTKFADKFADKHPGRSWDGAHPEPCWSCPGIVPLPAAACAEPSSHCEFPTAMSVNFYFCEATFYLLLCSKALRLSQVTKRDVQAGSPLSLCVPGCLYFFWMLSKSRWMASLLHSLSYTHIWRLFKVLLAF